MKTVKPFFHIFLSILFSINVQSQGWIAQGKGILPANYFTWALSAVDEQTVWALCRSAENDNPKLISTADGGETWVVKDVSNFQSQGNAMDIHAFSATSIWLVTRDGSLYHSIDTANTWELKYNSQSNGNQVGPALKFGDEESGYMIDPVHIAASYSLNGGETWTTTNMFPTFKSGEFWGMINPTNWMDAKGDTIWWGTTKYIHRSTDNGVSWEAIDNGFAHDFETKCVSFSQSSTGLAISNAGPTEPYIVGETHISRSLDGGASWTELPVQSFPLEGISDVPGSNDAFVGVGGIFNFIPDLNLPYLSAYTLDAGETWEVIDSFPLNAVEFVSPTVGWAGPLSNYDYGGNPAIFKWDGFNLGPIVGTGETTSLSPIISPNPFSNHLQVNFSETRQGLIQLKDISGRIMKQTFFHDQLLELNDLEYLPPGIYILELKGKDFITSKKVVKH